MNSGIKLTMFLYLCFFFIMYFGPEPDLHYFCICLYSALSSQNPLSALFATSRVSSLSLVVTAAIDRVGLHAPGVMTRPWGQHSRAKKVPSQKEARTVGSPLRLTSLIRSLFDLGPLVEIRASCICGQNTTSWWNEFIIQKTGHRGFHEKHEFDW